MLRHVIETNQTIAWVDRASARIRSACQQKQVAIFTVFSLIYFAGSGFVAISKPLWFDEIFTFELSKLSFREIVTALHSGLDDTPPLYNWINRICVLLLGESRFAIRLPSLIGCWVMALCLFLFVRKRLPALYAFIAMLCPFWLSVRVYAFEARPYGMLLGLTAAALLLWQHAVEGQRVRKPALAGLAICMAAGSSVHFYFILLLVPLALGEAVRSFGTGRAQLTVWLAFVSCLVTLPFHYRIIIDALSYSGDLWSRPAWRHIPEFYLDEMGSLLLPGIFLLCSAVLYLAAAPARRTVPASSLPCGFRDYEVAAIVGFLIVPAVAISTAIMQTGIFVFRYALIAALGASLLAAVVTALGDRAVPSAGALLFLMFSLKFAAFQVSRVLPGHIDNSIPSLIAEAQHEQLPIVMAGPIDYLEVVHRAPRALAARLYYVADAQLARQYAGSAAADRGLLILQKRRLLNVRSYEEFISEHGEFLVYSKPADKEETNFEWLPAKLAEDKRPIFLRRLRGRESLYQVARQPQLALPSR